MDVRLFSWAFFVSSFFPNIWCHDSDQVCSQHWPCFPVPPPDPTLSLSQLPLPSSRIWAALLEPTILESPAPSLAHREFPPPQCASICHPPPANPPSRSSVGESFSHTETWSLSHFLEILALGLGSLPSLGTGFPRTVDPPWWRRSSREFHLYSLLRNWYLGTPTISFLRSGLTMEIGLSQIPSDSPLGCFLANLGPLRLTPDLKPWKLIFLCNQAWPQYPLDNAPKWSLNGTFNPNILRDLYNFCEHTGKWKEIPYTQSFSYLCT
jgi:hypothetical protein